MRSKSNEVKKQIVEFVNKYYCEHNNTPSNTQIAEAIGRSRGNIHNYLIEMSEEGMLSYSGREIRTEFMKKHEFGGTKAAILGSIACGPLNFAEENIEEYVSLPESLFGKGEFFILRARGNSMIEAGIDEGDLVIIRKQDTAQNGQIVVALVEDEATLKRFYKEEGGIRLHPENHTMEDILVDNCMIQGVAVKVVKNLL